MGVAVGSVFAFLIWIVCDIIGLIPITSERVRKFTARPSSILDSRAVFWVYYLRHGLSIILDSARQYFGRPAAVDSVVAILGHYILLIVLCVPPIST
jgi:hypothetical protein